MRARALTDDGPSSDFDEVKTTGNHDSDGDDPREACAPVRGRAPCGNDNVSGRDETTSAAFIHPGPMETNTRTVSVRTAIRLARGRNSSLRDSHPQPCAGGAGVAGQPLRSKGL